jgi:hypothetical protein
VLVAERNVENGASTGSVEPSMVASQEVIKRFWDTRERDSLVIIASKKVRPNASEVCQVDMTNAIRAINEAEDFHVLISLHQSLPRQAYARKSDNSIKHSDPHIAPMQFHVLYYGIE